MKPVRRFISTVITKNKQQQQQQQQEKIHHSTRFQQQQHKNLSPNRVEILSKHSLASPTTSLLKRIAYYPINSLTRLALRALFQLGEQSANNAPLATTSINRALKYSVGVTTSPSSRVHTAVRMEPAPNQAAPTNADIDTNTAQVTNTAAGEIKRVDDTTPVPTAESRLEENDPMVALEDHRSGTTLACLREAYANSRKKGTNVWLDFADKSCYIYLYRGGGEPNRSLAAFDLDGTLIKPKSNKRIPRSATDWDLFSVWTKIKLQQCLRENHARFVIFTNQNGVGLEIVPLEEVQHRIELVTKRLDIPCTVFVAIEKDIFRKPQTGMFQLFNKSFNDLLPVDFASSFYCGDAIGYPSHSDADIKFAKQLGFPFLTPEKFLRGVKPKLVS